MKILADLHHEDLYGSLLLLAERLGAELRRPCGMDWYRSGTWLQHSDDASALQYLGPDTYKGFRGVLLGTALKTDWDIVIVSHPNNIEPWVRTFEQKAPIVLQVGNAWHYMAPQFKGITHVLNSTSTHWPNRNHVRYHPEFKLPKISSQRPKTIASFSHCPQQPALDRINRLGEALGPEWDVLIHGANAPDGPITQAETEALMRQIDYVVHDKPGGDGYGFNVHRALASNCVVVCDYEHYSDQSFARCMVDRVSTIDLGLGVETAAEQIKDHQGAARLSIEPVDIWMANCDPDYEWEHKLKPFFEKVLSS